MSDPIWPASLPIPLRAGYNANRKLNLIRTEMEGGPIRVSRYSDHNESMINFQLMLDVAQQSTFEAFFDGDCNGGATWISMPIDTGVGISSHRVRFSSVSWQSISATHKRLSLLAEVEHP